jgi:SAM-dependent methyltransferase
MRKEYGEVLFRQKASRIKERLERAYIGIFGIPEIGFQLRGLHFRRIIGKHLAKQRFTRILDAGSGIGAYAFLLTARFPQAEIVAYEIDDAKLSVCADIAAVAGLRRIDFIRHDLTARTPITVQFDLIVNIDVLEHITDYEAVLDNFEVSLKRGGYLFIHTPQPNQRRIFNSLSSWGHQGHVREGFLPNELCQYLSDRGFSVVACRETFGPFGKFAWELNHIILAKSLALGAFTFPILYLLATLDLLNSNRRGLGTALLASKR